MQPSTPPNKAFWEAVTLVGILLAVLLLSVFHLKGWLPSGNSGSEDSGGRDPSSRSRSDRSGQTPPGTPEPSESSPGPDVQPAGSGIPPPRDEPRDPRDPRDRPPDDRGPRGDPPGGGGRGPGVDYGQPINDPAPGDHATINLGPGRSANINFEPGQNHRVIVDDQRGQSQRGQTRPAGDVPPSPVSPVSPRPNDYPVPRGILRGVPPSAPPGRVRFQYHPRELGLDEHGRPLPAVSGINPEDFAAPLPPGVQPGSPVGVWRVKLPDSSFVKPEHFRPLSPLVSGEELAARNVGEQEVPEAVPTDKPKSPVSAKPEVNESEEAEALRKEAEKAEEKEKVKNTDTVTGLRKILDEAQKNADRLLKELEERRKVKQKEREKRKAAGLGKNETPEELAVEKGLKELQKKLQATLDEAEKARLKLIEAEKEDEALAAAEEENVKNKEKGKEKEEKAKEKGKEKETYKEKEKTKEKEKDKDKAKRKVMPDGEDSPGEESEYEEKKVKVKDKGGKEQIVTVKEKKAKKKKEKKKVAVSDGDEESEVEIEIENEKKKVDLKKKIKKAKDEDKDEVVAELESRLAALEAGGEKGKPKAKTTKKKDKVEGEAASESEDVEGDGKDPNKPKSAKTKKRIKVGKDTASESEAEEVPAAKQKKKRVKNANGGTEEVQDSGDDIKAKPKATRRGVEREVDDERVPAGGRERPTSKRPVYADDDGDGGDDSTPSRVRNAPPERARGGERPRANGRNQVGQEDWDDYNSRPPEHGALPRSRDQRVTPMRPMPMPNEHPEDFRRRLQQYQTEQAEANSRGNGFGASARGAERDQVNGQPDDELDFGGNADSLKGRFNKAHKGKGNGDHVGTDPDGSEAEEGRDEDADLTPKQRKAKAEAMRLKREREEAGVESEETDEESVDGATSKHRAGRRKLKRKNGVDGEGNPTHGGNDAGDQTDDTTASDHERGHKRLPGQAAARPNTPEFIRRLREERRQAGAESDHEAGEPDVVYESAYDSEDSFFNDRGNKENVIPETQPGDDATSVPPTPLQRASVPGEEANPAVPTAPAWSRDAPRPVSEVELTPEQLASEKRRVEEQRDREMEERRRNRLPEADNQLQRDPPANSRPASPDVPAPSDKPARPSFDQPARPLSDKAAPPETPSPVPEVTTPEPPAQERWERGAPGSAPERPRNALDEIDPTGNIRVDVRREELEALRRKEQQFGTSPESDRPSWPEKVQQRDAEVKRPWADADSEADTDVDSKFDGDVGDQAAARPVARRATSKQAQLDDIRPNPALIPVARVGADSLETEVNDATLADENVSRVRPREEEKAAQKRFERGEPEAELPVKSKRNMTNDEISHGGGSGPAGKEQSELESSPRGVKHAAASSEDPKHARPRNDAKPSRSSHHDNAPQSSESKPLSRREECPETPEERSPVSAEPPERGEVLPREWMTEEGREKFDKEEGELRKQDEQEQGRAFVKEMGPVIEQFRKEHKTPLTGSDAASAREGMRMAERRRLAAQTEKGTGGKGGRDTAGVDSDAETVVDEEDQDNARFSSHEADALLKNKTSASANAKAEQLNGIVPEQTPLEVNRVEVEQIGGKTRREAPGSAEDAVDHVSQEKEQARERFGRGDSNREDAKDAEAARDLAAEPTPSGGESDREKAGERARVDANGIPIGGETDGFVANHGSRQERGGKKKKKKKKERKKKSRKEREEMTEDNLTGTAKPTEGDSVEDEATQTDGQEASDTSGKKRKKKQKKDLGEEKSDQSPRKGQEVLDGLGDLAKDAVLNAAKSRIDDALNGSEDGNKVRRADGDGKDSHQADGSETTKAPDADPDQDVVEDVPLSDSDRKSDPKSDRRRAEGQAGDDEAPMEFGHGARDRQDSAARRNERERRKKRDEADRNKNETAKEAESGSRADQPGMTTMAWGLTRKVAHIARRSPLFSLLTFASVLVWVFGSRQLANLVILSTGSSAVPIPDKRGLDADLEITSAAASDLLSTESLSTIGLFFVVNAFIFVSVLLTGLMLSCAVSRADSTRMPNPEAWWRHPIRSTKAAFVACLAVFTLFTPLLMGARMLGPMTLLRRATWRTYLRLGMFLAQVVLAVLLIRQGMSFAYMLGTSSTTSFSDLPDVAVTSAALASALEGVSPTTAFAAIAMILGTTMPALALGLYALLHPRQSRSLSGMRGISSRLKGNKTVANILRLAGAVVITATFVGMMYFFGEIAGYASSASTSTTANLLAANATLVIFVPPLGWALLTFWDCFRELGGRMGGDNGMSCAGLGCASV